MIEFFSPLEQFEVFILYPYFIHNMDISITNFSVFIIFIFVIYYQLISFSLYKPLLVGNSFQTSIELLFNFIVSMLRGNFNRELTNKYLPFIFSIFIFILFSNLLGIIPYSFTVTSHIVVTFAFALVVFIYFITIAVVKYKRYFFSHFFPAGSPLWLAPLLVIIEVISYVLRVVSLSVRLFANMMSGHALLKVLATFAWAMMCARGYLFFLSIVPVIIIFLLTGLETGVACLQAYVFTVLTIIYIEESVNFH